MGIVSCEEKMGVREAAVSRDWTRTYRRVFIVETNDPTIGPRTVSAAPGFVLGNFYQTATESDAGAFLTEMSVKEVAEDGKQWEVELSYGPYDPAAFPENPLSAPLDIDWGFNPYERVVDQDINGNAVVNTAGDPFDPPVTMEDPRPALVIVRNEPIFNPAMASSWKNAVNLDFWWQAGPGEAKVAKISGRRAWNQYLSAIAQKNGFYWIVTYEFDFNPDGWIKSILSQGMRELKSGTLTPITADGVPITSPALLDQAGAQLQPGADPFFCQFQVYPQLEFASLNLVYPGP